MSKFLFLLVMLIGLTGCYSNPEVKAGFEGYIFESPRVWGNGGFKKTITGPGANGFSIFNYNKTEVDMRIKTYEESFQILTKDKLNMSVRVQLLLSLKTGSVKTIVEKFNGSKFYDTKVKKVFRSLVRDAVQGFSSGELKEKRNNIQLLVETKVKNYLKGTPILFEKLVVGNIDFPAKIVAAIETRLAKQEEEKAKDIENRIAKRDADIRKTEAIGIRDAQQIIDQSLTNNYLQYEAIKAQAKMANSPNHTTIYIPVGANGIPIIKTSK